MKKNQKFINALQDVIVESRKEIEKIKKHDSIWRLDIIEDVILPEITKLLHFAKKGEIYFEYGSNQRRLHSTYIVLEDFIFQENSFARKILDLQYLYDVI